MDMGIFHTYRSKMQANMVSKCARTYWLHDDLLLIEI